MHYSSVAAEFGTLKSARRTNAVPELQHLAAFSIDALRLLRSETKLTDIEWRGAGDKAYAVAATRDAARWSRPLNLSLLISDPEDLASGWQSILSQINRRRGSVLLPTMYADLLDKVLYTSSMAYAALVDLHGGGSAGTAFEMYCGTTISALTGLEERGDIVLETAPNNPIETVKIDVHFEAENRGSLLCVPTKISTRERITQVFVHARILDVAVRADVRTALCVINETNAFKEPSGSRRVEDVYLRETLVPGTIALYQKYIHPIDGIYYLDPPHPYIDGTYSGLPRVRTVGELLTVDLEELLT